MPLPQDSKAEDEGDLVLDDIVRLQDQPLYFLHIPIQFKRVWIGLQITRNILTKGYFQKYKP